MNTYYTMAEAQRKTGFTANRISDIATRIGEKLGSRIPKSLVDAIVEEQEQFITCNHHKKVWWLYPYDDPVLGHFDFEWEAAPNTRMTEPGCPFLEGNGVWPGYNDLLSRYPLVASQFHPTRNGTVSPTEISFASNKTYWWYLPYDDPVLGHFDFEWEAKVNNRTLLGENCPFLGNDKVWKGYNDLLSCVPLVAREWHKTKNRRLKPDEVYKESTKKVWWKCSVCGYEWFGSVRGRTVNGIGCQKCHRNGPFIL